MKIALVCSLLSACATPPRALESPAAIPAPEVSTLRAAEADPPSEDRDEERFRFVSRAESGLESVLLVPTPVEGMVALGPMARSRVFVGALFATQRIGAERHTGVGLVVKAVGGGLGPALSAAPFVVVTVDGDRVLRRSVAERGLYAAERGPWGMEETLTFRVLPEVVEAMARGGDVEVRLGRMVIFRLDDEQRGDFRDFLDQIPEGTVSRTRAEAKPVPGWKSH